MLPVIAMFLSIVWYGSRLEDRLAASVDNNLLSECSSRGVNFSGLLHHPVLIMLGY
jgi:hypothetical protein